MNDINKDAQPDVEQDNGSGLEKLDLYHVELTGMCSD